jgi:hypothetical protein
MNLSNLTDSELLQHAYLQQDPLRCTELELVLFERFGVLVDKANAADAALMVLEEYDLDPMKTKDIESIKAALELANRPYVNELLDVIMNNDIDSPTALQSVFENLRQLETQE